jgi:hypothetical protein
MATLSFCWLIWTTAFYQRHQVDTDVPAAVFTLLQTGAIFILSQRLRLTPSKTHTHTPDCCQGLLSCEFSPIAVASDVNGPTKTLKQPESPFYYTRHRSYRVLFRDKPYCF